MQSGAQLLREWIKRRGYSQIEAANVLGIRESFMSMLVNAHRTPGLHIALQIERMAGIPAAAWASSRVDKTGSVAKRRVA
jgi:plasmid maintenance system antidote protein VapI